MMRASLPGGLPPHTMRVNLPTAALFAGLVLLATGCQEGIDSTYGRGAGAAGGASVNGTAVLARMFEQQGHQVSRSIWLTPRLQERAEVIVWAPDDFAAPTNKVREWFDNWWKQDAGRILVYIGRDYDAAHGYWRTVLPGSPPGKVPEMKRRLARAYCEFLRSRQEIAAEEQADWFTIKGRRRFRRVRSLSGPWSAGVNGKQVQIELNGRLLPAGNADVLLHSKGDPLVSRSPQGDGELILVANGSFLLNLPLVNREHRKLAGKLIAATGGNRRVVFLESGPGGPQVLDEEPSLAMRNGMEIFGVPPFDTILVHLALVGLAFLVYRFPIFGRAKSLEDRHRSDFGRHIGALGMLLARTRDAHYARSRVEHYQHAVRRESGRFRRPAVQAAQHGATGQSAGPPRRFPR